MSEQLTLYRIHGRDVYTRFDEMLGSESGCVSLEQFRRALHTVDFRSYGDICEVKGVWRLSGRMLKDLKQVNVLLWMIEVYETTLLK